MSRVNTRSYFQTPGSSSSKWPAHRSRTSKRRAIFKADLSPEFVDLNNKGHVHKMIQGYLCKGAANPNVVSHDKRDFVPFVDERDHLGRIITNETDFAPLMPSGVLSKRPSTKGTHDGPSVALPLRGFPLKDKEYYQEKNDSELLSLNFNISAGADRVQQLAPGGRAATAAAGARRLEAGLQGLPPQLAAEARLQSAGTLNALNQTGELWFAPLEPEGQTPVGKRTCTSSFLAPPKKGIVDEKRVVPPVGYYNCYEASPPRALPEGFSRRSPKVTARFPSTRHRDADLPYKNLLGRFEQSSFRERRAFEFARQQKRDEVSYLRDYARISEAKGAGIDPQYWNVFNFKHKKSQSMMANSIEYQNAQSHIGFGGSFGDAEALKARIAELKEITSKLAKNAY